MPITRRALPIEEWACSLTAARSRAGPAAETLATHLPRHDQSGQVPGTAAGHKAAARRRREAGQIGQHPQGLVLRRDGPGGLQP